MFKISLMYLKVFQYYRDSLQTFRLSLVHGYEKAGNKIVDPRDGHIHWEVIVLDWNDL